MKFSKILDIGLSEDLEFYQKREIRILNLFALITFVGLIIGATNIFFIGQAYPAIAESLVALSMIGILFLNHLKKYAISAYAFVLSINISVFFICEHYDMSTGTYLFYFPLVFCVALLHNPHKSNKRTITFFSFILISFLCSMIFDVPFIKGTALTAEQNHVLFMYDLNFCVILTIVLVYMVIQLINRQNSDLVALLKKEHDAQVVITHSLKEKETLLAEIQHRVKNNLAVITGLLNLQMEKAPCDVSKSLMIESRNRVMSIAMIHERLYKKDNLSKIDLKLYLSELVNEVVKSFPLQSQIQIIEDLEDVEIELTKAVPAGLIVNEVVTNSLKHAFNNDMKSPVITIQMKKIFDCMQISLSDNGVGFTDIKNRKDTSLGITLIESLADQIDAKVSFRNNNGAYVNFVFAI